MVQGSPNRTSWVSKALGSTPCSFCLVTNEEIERRKGRSSTRVGRCTRTLTACKGPGLSSDPSPTLPPGLRSSLDLSLFEESPIMEPARLLPSAMNRYSTARREGERMEEKSKGSSLLDEG